MELDIQLQEAWHLTVVPGVAHCIGHIHQLQAQRRRRVLRREFSCRGFDGGTQLGQ
jgi:hypothetical protein